MRGKLQDHVDIGVCHNTFYQCKHDPKGHVDGLEEIMSFDFIQQVDLTIPYTRACRERAIEIVNQSDKRIIYNGYLMPTGLIPLCTLSDTEREQLLILIRDQIDMAYAVGAELFLQSVGADPGDEQRHQAYQGLATYIKEVEAYIKGKGDMGFTIELMDRHVDKKSLCGPTAEVVAFLEQLKPHGIDAGLVVDIAHIPLMEESIEDVIRTAAPLTKHVHVGTCILKDRNHRWWGDMHPPLGTKGSEIGQPELVRALRALHETEYFNKENKPILTLEIRAFPGLSVRDTLLDNIQRLEDAWRMM